VLTKSGSFYTFLQGMWSIRNIERGGGIEYLDRGLS